MSSATNRRPTSIIKFTKLIIYFDSIIYRDFLRTINVKSQRLDSISCQYVGDFTDKQI